MLVRPQGRSREAEGGPEGGPAAPTSQHGQRRARVAHNSHQLMAGIHMQDEVMRQLAARTGVSISKKGGK